VDPIHLIIPHIGTKSSDFVVLVGHFAPYGKLPYNSRIKTYGKHTGKGPKYPYFHRKRGPFKPP
ncbi:MAG: hypothetical protein ACYTEQ_28775, partial [Planctomycetota bacterium]